MIGAKTEAITVDPGWKYRSNLCFSPRACCEKIAPAENVRTPVENISFSLDLIKKDSNFELKH